MPVAAVAFDFEKVKLALKLAERNRAAAAHRRDSSVPGRGNQGRFTAAKVRLPQLLVLAVQALADADAVVGSEEKSRT